MAAKKNSNIIRNVIRGEGDADETGIAIFQDGSEQFQAASRNDLTHHLDTFDSQGTETTVATSSISWDQTGFGFLLVQGSTITARTTLVQYNSIVATTIGTLNVSPVGAVIGWAKYSLDKTKLFVGFSTASNDGDVLYQYAIPEDGNIANVTDLFQVDDTGATTSTDGYFIPDGETLLLVGLDTDATTKKQIQVITLDLSYEFSQGSSVGTPYDINESDAITNLQSIKGIDLKSNGYLGVLIADNDSNANQAAYQFRFKEPYIWDDFGTTMDTGIEHIETLNLTMTDLASFEFALTGRRAFIASTAGTELGVTAYDVGVKSEGDLFVQGDAKVDGNLTVDGDIVSINTVSLNVKDNHVYLNNGYTENTPLKDGGLVVNRSATTGTKLEFTSAVFEPGNGGAPVATLSGITGSLSTDEGDFIQISGTEFNDGIYEIDDFTSPTLTIRGIGGTSTVENWSQNQFIEGGDDTSITGVVVPVQVTVIKSDPTTGVWGEGQGDAAGLDYDAFSHGNLPYLVGPAGADQSYKYNNIQAALDDARIEIDDNDNVSAITIGVLPGVTYPGFDMIRSGVSVIGLGNKNVINVDGDVTVTPSAAGNVAIAGMKIEGTITFAGAFVSELSLVNLTVLADATDEAITITNSGTGSVLKMANVVAKTTNEIVLSRGENSPASCIANECEFLRQAGGANPAISFNVVATSLEGVFLGENILVLGSLDFTNSNADLTIRGSATNIATSDVPAFILTGKVGTSIIIGGTLNCGNADAVIPTSGVNFTFANVATQPDTRLNDTMGTRLSVDGVVLKSNATFNGSYLDNEGNYTLPGLKYLVGPAGTSNSYKYNSIQEAIDDAEDELDLIANLNGITIAVMPGVGTTGYIGNLTLLRTGIAIVGLGDNELITVTGDISTQVTTAGEIVLKGINLVGRVVFGTALANNLRLSNMVIENSGESALSITNTNASALVHMDNVDISTTDDQPVITRDGTLPAAGIIGIDCIISRDTTTGNSSSPAIDIPAAGVTATFDFTNTVISGQVSVLASNSFILKGEGSEVNSNSGFCFIKDATNGFISIRGGSLDNGGNGNVIASSTAGFSFSNVSTTAGTTLNDALGTRLSVDGVVLKSNATFDGTFLDNTGGYNLTGFKYVVGPSGSGYPYATINLAIAAILANSETVAVILVTPGTYVEDVDLSSTTSPSLTILGLDRQKTTIDGSIRIVGGVAGVPNDYTFNLQNITIADSAAVTFLGGLAVSFLDNENTKIFLDNVSIIMPDHINSAPCLFVNENSGVNAGNEISANNTLFQQNDDANFAIHLAMGVDTLMNYTHCVIEQTDTGSTVSAIFIDNDLNTFINIDSTKITGSVEFTSSDVATSLFTLSNGSSITTISPSDFCLKVDGSDVNIFVNDSLLITGESGSDKNVIDSFGLGAGIFTFSNVTTGPFALLNDTLGTRLSVDGVVLKSNDTLNNTFLNNTGGYSTPAADGDLEVNQSAHGFSVEDALAIGDITVAVAVCPGANADGFTTGDDSANNFAGDLDFRVEVALDDWIDSSTNTFFEKGSGTDISYRFQIGNVGGLEFFASTTGAGSNIGVSSTENTNFGDGTRHFIRVTRVQSTGDITFYTSEDGRNWDQLGNVISNAVGPLFPSTADLVIGNNELPSADFITGDVYRVLLLSGVDGTVTVDFDPNDYVSGTDWDSTITGETWTFNGAVSISSDTQPGFILAKADVLSTANAIGLVTSVIDVKNFILTTSGFKAIFTGLEPGLTYYLSDSTAGEVTTTEPTISRGLYNAISPTEAYIFTDAIFDEGALDGAHQFLVGKNNVDHTYEYNSIQEAITAALPLGVPVVIFVMPGEYDEALSITYTNISFATLTESTELTTIKQAVSITPTSDGEITMNGFNFGDTVTAGGTGAITYVITHCTGTTVDPTIELANENVASSLDIVNSNFKGSDGIVILRSEDNAPIHIDNSHLDGRIDMLSTNGGLLSLHNCSFPSGGIDLDGSEVDCEISNVRAITGSTDTFLILSGYEGACTATDIFVSGSGDAVKADLSVSGTFQYNNIITSPGVDFDPGDGTRLTSDGVDLQSEGSVTDFLNATGGYTAPGFSDNIMQPRRTFASNATTAITAFADNTTFITITAAGHGLAVGDYVQQLGFDTDTALNDTFLVLDTDGNDYDIISVANTLTVDGTPTTQKINSDSSDFGLTRLYACITLTTNHIFRIMTSDRINSTTANPREFFIKDETGDVSGSSIIFVQNENIIIDSFTEAAGTVTLTTNIDHIYAVGQVVELSGFIDTGNNNLNAELAITAVTTNEFSVAANITGTTESGFSTLLIEDVPQVQIVNPYCLARLYSIISEIHSE